jgi:hypothetical protein
MIERLVKPSTHKARTAVADLITEDALRLVHEVKSKLACEADSSNSEGKGPIVPFPVLFSQPAALPGK